jgi:hypothetical protein
MAAALSAVEGLAAVAAVEVVVEVVVVAAGGSARTPDAETRIRRVAQRAARYCLFMAANGISPGLGQATRMLGSGKSGGRSE